MNLIRPMILAGTSEFGACVDCGAPWRRVVRREKLTRERPNEYVKRNGEEGTGNSCSNSIAGVEVRTVGWEPTCTCRGKFVKRRVIVPRKTHEDGQVPKGWAVGAASHSPQDHNTEEGRAAVNLDVSAEVTATVTEYVCGCGVSWGEESKGPSTEDERPLGNKLSAADGKENRGSASARMGRGAGWRKDPNELDRSAIESRTVERPLPCDCYADAVRPCVVLDPFLGSGTTAAVCVELGRACWGIDLSEKYLRENAVPRIEGAILARPALADLVKRPPVVRIAGGRPGRRGGG